MLFFQLAVISDICCMVSICIGLSFVSQALWTSVADPLSWLLRVSVSDAGCVIPACADCKTRIRGA